VMFFVILGVTCVFTVMCVVFFVILGVTCVFTVMCVVFFVILGVTCVFTVVCVVFSMCIVFDGQDTFTAKRPLIVLCDASR